MHWVAAGHDMPDRLLYVAPDGLGVDATVQLVPFQVSARVKSPPRNV
jgi:hypothetical protein